jgi:hypothetical protein
MYLHEGKKRKVTKEEESETGETKDNKERRKMKRAEEGEGRGDCWMKSCRKATGKWMSILFCRG